MLILSRRDVESLLTIADAIDVVEEGFRQLAAGNVIMPQRVATRITPHAGLHLAMPAFVAGDPGILVVKIVTVYGDNPARYGLPAIQGLLLLHDATSGQPLALMDAEYLTAIRTGAASGVATRYLARPNATTVALFGAGAQAGAQLAAVCATRPIRCAFVITRTGQKDANFCARVEKELGVQANPAREARAAVEAADIICTATNAHEPLFPGEWLMPGAHINAIGAYTASMRELDATAIARSRLVVDHHTAAQTEAGDILLAMAEGAITYAHVAGELGAVIRGDIPGRTRDDEITLFKSVGLAMQDAMAAARVYALAIEQGVGKRIEW